MKSRIISIVVVYFCLAFIFAFSGCFNKDTRSFAELKKASEKDGVVEGSASAAPQSPQDLPATSEDVFAPAHQATLSPSLYKDAMRSVRAGLRWLESVQAEDGYWSNAQFPAMTALVVWAGLRNPDVITYDEEGYQHIEVLPFIQKGIDYVLTCVNPNGSIYKVVEGIKGGGLRNYNTAICLAALVATGDAQYEDVILNARKALINMQYLGGGAYDGGMGYDAVTSRPYADMSNTYLAIESVKVSDFLIYSDYKYCLPPESPKLLEEFKGYRDEARREGNERESFNWDRAVAFLTRCQNLPDTNADASIIADDRGGFIYKPDESKAGSRVGPDGKEYLRSYASMTYGGLLSFIYAEVTRDDPRVQAAYDWIKRHFTVDENPGLGQRGLYYNYHTMAKALTAYGVDTVELPDGTQVDWRQALVEKLISLQKINPATGDGYWVNTDGAWWENDPVLATSYALLALEICMEGTAP